MSNRNLSFIGVGRVRDHLLLALQFDRMHSSEKTEIEEAFAGHLSAASGRITPGGRDKRPFKDGTFFLLADRELTCVYGVLVNNKTYPERVAYQVLQEVQQCIRRADDCPTLNSISHHNGLTRYIRQDLRQLMEKYDNAAAADKTCEVAVKVDNVKGAMTENINKVMATHANLQDLEGKTDQMHENAAMFGKNAGELKRLMHRRKMKITIIIVVLVIAAIVAALCAIFIK
ncbi:MAG: uncharacterized protein KVP18_001074 [Porospora cf. gigantea A]|uniref:uncharacterized protein n=1 Tax=Porospora cf. gigantea A TaxID=2853593 RepID=UPI00355947AC|nr:MAG: hypothetical protein KVP18_001074 [Porospora cf. gigantea A]